MAIVTSLGFSETIAEHLQSLNDVITQLPRKPTSSTTIGYLEALHQIHVMKSNTIEMQTLEEYLKNVETAAASDRKDHWFDRTWIAKYLKKEPTTGTFLPYSRHEITEEDIAIASEESKKIAAVKVPGEQIAILKNAITYYAEHFPDIEIQNKESRNWKEKRDVIKKAAQDIVNSITSKFFDHYGFNEKICHVKVQEAVGVYLNNQPIPAFFTIPQMLVATNTGLHGAKRSFEIVAVETKNDGFVRNIVTKQV